MIRLIALGRLSDLCGSDLTLAAEAPIGWDALVRALPEQLAAALADDRVRVARNGVLIARDALVAAPGDEIALLPPVSGG